MLINQGAIETGGGGVALANHRLPVATTITCTTAQSQQVLQQAKYHFDNPKYVHRQLHNSTKLGKVVCKITTTRPKGEIAATYQTGICLVRYTHTCASPSSHWIFRIANPFPYEFQTLAPFCSFCIPVYGRTQSMVGREQWRQVCRWEKSKHL